MRYAGETDFIFKQCKFLKGVALRMCVLAALVVPSSPLAQADDNGSGNVSDPQTDFCRALVSSCEVPCNAMNDGSEAGAANERQCFDRCHAAGGACFAENRANKPGLKMQLPLGKKPSPKGITPPPKAQQ